ncbi:MAG TPA: hypothetical protein VFN90_04125 [Gemmatimonadales bacterium]|nr:hypothetical protein [Gemmatimonadales bacterium]
MLPLRLALAPLLAATLGAASPVAAQSPTPVRVGLSNPTSETAAPAPRLRLEVPRTGIEAAQGSHWRTGGIIGAGVGAVAGLLLTGLNGEFTAGDAVFAVGFGALVGGIPGALIGSLFPKGESSREPK